MLKVTIAFFAILLLLATRFAIAGEASKDDLKRLQGKWKIISYTIDGKSEGAGAVWTFKDNKLHCEDREGHCGGLRVL